MAHATADIGTTNYEVSLVAGHHSVKADEGFEAGGKDLGPAPHELLCAALGACTLMTMQLYAKRKGWTLDNLSVRISYHKGNADQRDRFDRIIELGDVTPEQRDGLLKIAQRCPVDLLLERGADVTVTMTETALSAPHADCMHAQEIDDLCREAG